MALSAVASNGSLNRVKALVKQGTDLKACDNKNSTPLVSDAQKGYLDQVKYLVENCHVTVYTGNHIWAI